MRAKKHQALFGGSKKYAIETMNGKMNSSSSCSPLIGDSKMGRMPLEGMETALAQRETISTEDHSSVHSRAAIVESSIKSLGSVIIFVWLAVGAFQSAVRAQEPDEDIETLIGQLQNIAEGDLGYMATQSGSSFAPLNVSESSVLLLGQQPPASSTTVSDIVKHGVLAVPHLIKHIDDERPTKMILEHGGGFGGMFLNGEYDYNAATSKITPKGVNGDSFGDGKHITTYTVTVGDLCFVALGQIVNRRFNAVRYQPTAIIMVNSPVRNAALRAAVVAEWSNLDEEIHKQTLIQDFVNADSESRRIGAYLRLAFYYPDTVEELVLKELAKPTFDVFLVSDLCRNVLYKTKDDAARQQTYDDFIHQHGEAFAAGIRDQLFRDLELLEAHERRAISPPLTRFGAQPRELLIQLFGQPRDVKSTDRPILDVASESERARLIRALVHDDSRQIGEVVKQKFLKSPDDDYFAPACLRCLANRGFGPFLVEQLNKIDFADNSINYLHQEYLSAITHSKDQQVHDKLVETIKTTTNGIYFMSALSVVDDVDAGEIAERAVEILEGLPDDTDQGRSVLKMIRTRFPDQAKGVFASFLKKGSAKRAETLCTVLWNNDPLAIEVLAPLLDDTRSLNGFSIPMRVCDRAAEAISHTTPDIPFASEWSTSAKDSAIDKLKQYCRETSR